MKVIISRRRTGEVIRSSLVMERNVEQLLNRISLIAATVATISLLYLFYLISSSSSSSHFCFLTPPTIATDESSLFTISRTPFPKSSCQLSSYRRYVSPLTRSNKFRSSRSFLSRVASLSSLFKSLNLPVTLSNRTRALCVSAGAGHAVQALLDLGIKDVTGVDLVDYPPLVSRSDPHNLPFFDGVFELAFSDGLDGALFPAMYAAEMERTVRRGGVCVVVVRRCEDEAGVDDVKGLFGRSRVVDRKNVTFAGGAEMSVFVVKKKQ